ncbi:MAG TPA: hypothetical protein VNG91_04990 [Terriglobia bacterium]|nr:hypothetical protein [Terriglobia bacterium]
MKLFLSLLAAAALTASPLNAQSTGLPCHGRLFVSPMSGNLDTYVTAQALKQHLPFTLTNEKGKADLIMTGTSRHKKSHRYRTLAGNSEIGNQNTGAITIANKQGDILWTAAGEDRYIMWGAWAKEGPQQVANRIVKKLKKAVQRSCH